MKDLSDGHLLRRFREGCTSSFTELVHRHGPVLVKHARSVLGEGSPYEDVVQDVFLKLARERLVLPAETESDPEGERRQLLGWLHKVTRNACMDHIRSETRRKRRERDVAVAERTGGGLSSVEERDTRSVVERELAELPVDQREVLTLRLLAERSYREIADITGKKIGTVGWLVSEGLKTLSGRLAPLLGPDAGPPSVARAGDTGLGAMRGELR